uniref:Reverse transcriptase domain-containing protein n=1 Tax=Cannabis sativa TaxID=3483 RepID=A0A803QIS8_CANSA
MEDLAKSFSAALHLTDTENTIHSLAEHVDPNEGLPPAPPQFHLMATLFTTKNFNHNALKNYLEKHWKGRFPVSVKERSPNSNLYLAAFHCEGDRRRTILNQPWTFDKCPILLEIPDTDSTLSPDTMRKIPFWVQIHNIPFSRRSISLPNCRAKSPGTLLEIHRPPYLKLGALYMVQIMFDVTKLLPLGIPIVFPGLASPTCSKGNAFQLRIQPFFCSPDNFTPLHPVAKFVALLSMATGCDEAAPWNSQPGQRNESHHRNALGFGRTEHSNLSLLVRLYKPSLLFVIETKLCKNSIDRFKAKLGFDFGFEVPRPTGPALTWTNNSQGNRRTLERLDWAVGNSFWHCQFPNSTLNHLDFFGSDHRAIQLSLNPNFHSRCPRRKDKRFLFENVWLSEPHWNDVLLEAWSSTPPNNDPSSDLLRKQSNCSTFLSSWKHKAFFGFQNRIKQAHQALEQARKTDDTSSESYYRQKTLQANLDSLLLKEETYWKQRSRIQWLQSGDKNTRFFHKFASNRKRSNRIASLTAEDGTVCQDPESILSLIQSFYSNLFTSQSPHELDIEAALFDPLPLPEPSQYQLLEEAFSSSEVEKALFQMGPDKAPGIDGFNNKFYQKNWSVVGKDVTEAILNVLNNDADISPFNSTLITLIPKVKKPVSLKDYRPISLCTTIYKIISKVLANRLKVILGPLISPNQSAFLKGRLISDNILMAQEILHSINNKKQGRESWMAVKLDMAKAFDRVEWTFLHKMMQKFQFPSRFIKLVMACITTATFKFNINGQAMGLVTPSRGIRQGDPLSPYLFLICAEGLSTILKRVERQDEAFGIKITRSAPRISHLLFADDSILFCKSNIQACNAIKEALDQYQNISGQQVNFQKSSLFFSPNTSLTYQTLIQDYMQIPMTNHLDKYLGLPQCFGRSKSSSFNSLKDRIWSYLSKWNGKFLSKGGKEILLKAVIQAIPSYAMSVFKLPDSFCNFVEKEMANFWWGIADGKHKLHWKSWKSLCNSKSLGGLGFRSLKPFNQAMLAKQAWRIHTNQSPLLTQLFKAKYFPRTPFLDSSLGHYPSYVWRSIHWGKSLLKSGLCKRIGNGANTSIFDPWIPNHRIFPSQVPPSLTHVSTLLLPNGDWNIPILRAYFRRDRLMTFVPPPPDPSKLTPTYGEDSTSGHYSVRTGYHVAKQAINQCWNARNASVFRNQVSRPETIEQEAQDYLAFYQAAQDKRGNHSQSTSDRDLLVWEPPPVGFLKLNTDAAISSHQNRTGGGALVRDHTGKIIAATAFNRIGQLHPQAAEGWALLEALKWCQDKGININHVEVDCKNLLTELQTPNENLTSFGNIINAIRRLLSSFPTVTLHHTRRQGNTAAHNLAQVSIGLDNTWSWNSQDPYPFPL